MKLADSLHRIGSDLVNCYLVEDAGGVTIIDAGLPGHWKELIAELELMGHSLDDVRGVVTHGDTDHIGFAERIRRERGVPVHVHELDAPLARGEVKKAISWGPIRWRSLLGFLWYSARRGGLRIPPVTDVVTFVDGKTLDLPGSPRIIGIPGHTPGSVAIHVPAVDALFVGDAMTTGHVLTAGPAAGALHTRCGEGACIARQARGGAGDLGPARPRRPVEWRGGRGAASGARRRGHAVDRAAAGAPLTSLYCRMTSTTSSSRSSSS